ncbi:pyridoxamine 5'-phosphate oxidase family protein [Roseomonas rosulenta]|uniref:pyridoxamine 5'-phosphate oxidase family protein n=1 Tax=Roseomonas rosulenta TaxID=2748667 RepID=UPI0018E057E6|nr:pyridoxamine 5'-phosphate oxidase family protein [Roseomonas rosulenta]
MTRPPPPATPQDALADAFRLLSRGVADRRSPFHTPTLATRGLDGAPDLRTVVLRGFDPATRLLRIHTDRRSAKAGEIAADPRAALHGYDAAAQVQIRIAGVASLHLDDATADAAWAASREMSRMCYATPHAPGAPVEEPPPAPQDAAAGRANFAAVTLRIDALDWLLLAAAGHRRARFAWDDAGALCAGWAAP